VPDICGRYFDGRRAVGYAVDVRAHVEGLTIFHDDGRLERWQRDDIVLRGDFSDESVLRLTPRQSPGVQLVFEDAAAIRAVVASLPSLRRKIPQPRNTRFWLGLTAGAAAVVGALVFTVDRLPAWAAPLVPAKWEAWLGESVVAAMANDDDFCQAPQGSAALEELAQRLSKAADLEQPVSVRVINAKMVNAFAVPGGRIGIFRGLIDEAESADEVAGVLAHEMGHVVHHHPTEGVLRQLGISATLQLLVGGSGVGIEDAAGLGNTLITLSYSRQAEAEADATALDILGKAGLDGSGLNRFFARLERENKVGGAVPSLLLTHPPTAERLAATADAPKGEPALTDAQWQALRKVCD
jgi:predicted Zn-dependent protease